MNNTKIVVNFQVTIIYENRLKGKFLSNLILVNHRGSIIWGSINCKTRASLDKEGRLTPQGYLLRPPDLCSQGHLYDV